MHEIDRDKTYRLLDVRDHDGRSKIDSKDFYKDIVGCIAHNIRKETFFQENDEFMCMAFVQDFCGNWISRNLRTSYVSEIKEENGTLEIHTENSIYIFEPAELLPPKYLDVANVIELYLTNESSSQFCKGFLYDAKKKPIELVCHFHLGTMQDTCLIYRKEIPGNIVCRYFPDGYRILFYNTLYGQQNYSKRMLIHNSGNDDLTVSFVRFPSKWTIAPGEAKWITPFDAEGADEEE